MVMSNGGKVVLLLLLLVAGVKMALAAGCDLSQKL